MESVHTSILKGISLKTTPVILADYNLVNALTETHKSQQLIDALDCSSVSTILFSLADMFNSADYHGSSLDEFQLMDISAKLSILAVRAGRKEGAL